VEDVSHLGDRQELRDSIMHRTVSAVEKSAGRFLDRLRDPTDARASRRRILAAASAAVETAPEWSSASRR